MSEKARTVSGDILLGTDSFEWEEFAVQFHDDWNIEIEAQFAEDNLIFVMGEAMITLSLVKEPVAQAIETAGNNYMWEQVEREVAKHVAHVKLGIIGAENPLQSHILFTMTASTALKQENAIGLYQYPVTRKASDYIQGAESLKQDNFPVSIWIFAGFYKNNEGLLNCYTYGLEEFDKTDIEIIGTKADMISTYRFIYQVIGFLITQNETLEDGTAIGESEDVQFDVTLSEGVIMDGTTAKIAFFTK